MYNITIFHIFPQDYRDSPRTPPGLLGFPQDYRDSSRTLWGSVKFRLDGTHFNCSSTPEQHALAHDRNGHVMQNCLAVCDFTHRFVYIFSSWEGSITNSTMFNDARITDLYVPTASGHYYLADAGFPRSVSLMLPY
jgi:DDE superfamily endonuclease